LALVLSGAEGGEIMVMTGIIAWAKTGFAVPLAERQNFSAGC
jgi:hypothetical protein